MDDSLVRLINFDPEFVLVARHAEALHRGQFRKHSTPGCDPEPYIEHPLRVAGGVMRETGDIELAKAALLHDAVEDCGASLADIAALVSDRCAATVDGVTRRPGEAYMDFIRRAAMNPDSWIVKKHDLLDNLSTLPPSKVDQSIRYVQALDILVHHDPRVQ